MRRPCLKQTQKGCSQDTRASWVVHVKTLILTVLVVFFYGGLVGAQSLDASKFVRILDGDVIEFVEGEYAVGKGIHPEITTWTRQENPNIEYSRPSGKDSGQYRATTGRFTFERSAISADVIAIYVIGMRWNFAVSVNEVEVFRNYATPTREMNTWYRPFLIPVTDDAMQPGLNTITIHAFSQQSVGVGRVLVGSHAALADHYESHFFWQITAPMAANFTMLFLGLLIFTIWIARRHEIEMLWLAISAVLWFIRNYEYYAEEIPFDPKLYVPLAVCCTYFATAASATFYLYFVKLKRRWIITVTMFAVGVASTFLFVATSFSRLVIYYPTMALVTAVAALAMWDFVKHRTFKRAALDLTIIFMPLASFYDVIMLLRYQGNGHAVYLSVFAGAVISAAFSISFGNRILAAFDGLGKTNLILEQKTAETRAELMESEAIRRELQVSQALTSERSRLMQEMHDGIGSNLTTALAVARQQKQPDKTITVLSRALGDLKLTVDSLEPIEGDIVALIGNLRHRMARDLDDAGITCKWEVEECAPLTWLDATNALHVLRIHNEAISNILSHSNAKEIRIGCVEAEQNGIAGISTYIADDGNGFEMGLETDGKGLVNIAARAQSLHGQLSYNSQPGIGTIVQLWLPYIRLEN